MFQLYAFRGEKDMAKGQITRRQKDLSRVLRDKKRIPPRERANKNRKDEKG